MNLRPRFPEVLRHRDYRWYLIGVVVSQIGTHGTLVVMLYHMYELTGSMDIALNSDANWKPFKLQAYFFIALIYFALCFAMSRYSRWVEARLNQSKQR